VKHHGICRTRSSSSSSSSTASTQTTVSGQHYEDVVEALAKRAISLAKQRQTSQHPKQQGPFIIGIAGAPGSGKSTLAGLAARRINELEASEKAPHPHVAITVPMDGFHLYKRQLDAMPDPKVR
jgi:pantothenate kinase